jgi:hypothetical protein
LRQQSRGHALRNRIFNLQHVRRLLIELIGPARDAFADVHQLRRHAQRSPTRRKLPSMT